MTTVIALENVAILLYKPEIKIYSVHAGSANEKHSTYC